MVSILGHSSIDLFTTIQLEFLSIFFNELTKSGPVNNGRAVSSNLVDRLHFVEEPSRLKEKSNSYFKKCCQKEEAT